MQVGNVQEANPSVPSDPERPENCKIRVVYEKFQPWACLNPKLAVHVRAVMIEFDDGRRDANLFEIGMELIKRSGCISPEKQIEALQEQNDILSEKVAELSSELTSKNAEINQLSVCCDNFEVDHSSLERSLAESEDLVKSLTEGINRVQGELASLSKSNKFLSEQNAAQRREINAKDEINARVTKEKSDLFVQVMSLANGLDRHCEACDILELVRMSMGGASNREIKQFFRGLTLSSNAVSDLCDSHRKLLIAYEQEREISSAYSSMIAEKDSQIEDLCRVIESRDAQIRDMEADYADGVVECLPGEAFSMPPPVVINITNYGFMHDKITQSIIDSIEKQRKIG